MKKNDIVSVFKDGNETLKYQESWFGFDQIFISKSMRSDLQECQVNNKQWLMMKDDSFGGEKPYRTYLGMNYLGGYSDHLPISVTLSFQN